MKIAVCVKQVPDSWAEKKMGSNGRLDRDNVDVVLNDLDEYAVEAALKMVEAHSPTGEAGEGSGHSITIISMGPERATEAVRKALSMGADDGIVIADAALEGSDALSTSAVLAAALKSGGYEIVFCGTESTDARMSVVPAMLAERLGYAQLTFAGSVTLDGSQVSISRQTEFGVEEMNAPLPVVISVVEKIYEPRYPSFKGIMAAKKKPLETKALADIGATAQNAYSKVVDANLLPPRSKGVKIEDDGSAANKLADFLAERRLV